MPNKYVKAIFGKGFFTTVIRYFDKKLQNLFIKFFRNTVKVDDKKIIFLNFTGNYDCNPKAICQKIIDQNLDADIVWAVNKKTRCGPEFFPVRIRKVIRGTYEFYKEISSAKVIVDNGISTAHLRYKKKRDQILIETWHGSLGIKKFGRDSNQDKNWLRKAAREGRMTDYIISNSTFEDSIYREDFWKKTPIWQFGHPRNDIFFESPDKIELIRYKICTKYKIPFDAHICLYAPTFRDDGDLSPYNINYRMLTHALTERFGGRWVIATRFHSRTKKYLKKYALPKNVFNLSGYPDIQEILSIIDCGITDYSSWICEYMLRRKPGFTFATDLESYEGVERQFFFPLSELPFPTSTDEKTLCDNIRSFDNDKFVEDCDRFLKEKGSVDDGHAAERVVEKLKEIMNIEEVDPETFMDYSGEGEEKMTVAILTAAGVGSRMGQDIPKQFIHVDNKPLIVYTMEVFQKHPGIDAMVVVTLPNWIDMVQAYASQFGITKLKWVVPGGSTGQESIRNGLMTIAANCPKDTVVMVHDGNRCLVSPEIISDSLAVYEEHGSAVAAIPCVEAVFLSENQGNSSVESIPREKLFRTQTPHTYSLEKLLWAHEQAKERGIENTAASCTLMQALGETVYFSAGSEENLKITTTDDLALFKVLRQTKLESWIKK
ncbi:MAG: CDP-glycerol glycerophosphotransferase family protein [Clostridia bacterium]|nr:CDP-glycerol glycerophosphotransferase family protein [Clostridia bacterium]